MLEYDDQADLRWAESADGGTIWFLEQTLGVGSSSAARQLNDWVSVIWPSAGTRYVAWNGWTEDSLNFRQYLRRGTGTPVGPTVTAAVWQPASDAPTSPRESRGRSLSGP